MNNDPLIGETINNYKIVQLIAQTGYSRLFLCESPKDKPICVKVISKSNRQIEECKSYDQIFMTEASALFILEHPNIIRIHDAAVDQNNYMIFMDFYRDGSLAHLLRRIPSMKENMAKIIFYSLLESVQYIHSRSVSHRNICPSNILLGPNHIILSDFGISSFETRINSQSTNIAYMAPEVFGDSEYDEKAADIWSCGIVLYEMLAGKIPWINFTNAIELIRQIRRGSYSFSPRIPQAARNLITKMLDMNPHTRIGIQAIFANPYIFQTRKSMSHYDNTMKMIINPNASKSKGAIGVLNFENKGAGRKPPAKYFKLSVHKSFG